MRLPNRLHKNDVIPEQVRHWVGRIIEVGRSYYLLDIWPYNWAKMKPRPEEQLFSISRRSKYVTKDGKFCLWTPVEIWTWREDGRDRIHLISGD